VQEEPEIGVSEEEIIVNEIDGEELKLSFNVDYTLEALKAIDGDEVTFAFNGAMKPFTVVDDNNNNGLQLILPVRRYQKGIRHMLFLAYVFFYVLFQNAIKKYT